MSEYVAYAPHAKVPIDSLLDDLLFDLQELPYDTAVHFIRRAAIRMAREGNILRRTAVISTQSCVDNYLLEPPDCVDIVAIMSVKNVRGSLCSAVTRLTQAPGRLPCGAFSWWTPPNEVHFTQVGCNYAYEVGFSVAPRRDACELDASFADKHYELLLVGARAMAYDLDDKPWTNRQRAEDYNTRFELGIRGAAIETMMGGQRGAFARPKRPRVL